MIFDRVAIANLSSWSDWVHVEDSGVLVVSVADLEVESRLEIWFVEAGKCHPSSGGFKLSSQQVTFLSARFGVVREVETLGASWHFLFVVHHRFDFAARHDFVVCVDCQIVVIRIEIKSDGNVDAANSYDHTAHFWLYSGLANMLTEGSS